MGVNGENGKLSGIVDFYLAKDCCIARYCYTNGCQDTAPARVCSDGIFTDVPATGYRRKTAFGRIKRHFSENSCLVVGAAGNFTPPNQTVCICAP